MSRRLRWAAAIAAAVVVAAVGGWIVFASLRSPSPEEAALAYLHAVESGDPKAVEATGAEVGATALAALDGATERITRPAVTGTHGTGENRRVEVSFRLGGEEHDATLSMSAVNGRWVVDGSWLGAVTPSTTAGTAVAIGAATLPAGDDTVLLPGTYAVAAAPAALLEGTSEVTVLPGETTAVEVDASLRPEATEAAQQHLDDHLTACTTPAPSPPPGCGIRLPWGLEFRDVSEVRYRIEQRPTVTLMTDGFTAAGGVLVATVTGTGQDGAPRTTSYRTDDWSLRGDVEFTAEGLRLTVW